MGRRRLFLPEEAKRRKNEQTGVSSEEQKARQLFLAPKRPVPFYFTADVPENAALLSSVGKVWDSGRREGWKCERSPNWVAQFDDDGYCVFCWGHRDNHFRYDLRCARCSRLVSKEGLCVYCQERMQEEGEEPAFVTLCFCADIVAWKPPGGWREVHWRDLTEGEAEVARGIGDNFIASLNVAMRGILFEQLLYGALRAWRRFGGNEGEWFEKYLRRQCLQVGNFVLRSIIRSLAETIDRNIVSLVHQVVKEYDPYCLTGGRAVWFRLPLLEISSAVTEAKEAGWHERAATLENAQRVDGTLLALMIGDKERFAHLIDDFLHGFVGRFGYFLKSKDDEEDAFGNVRRAALECVEGYDFWQGAAVTTYIFKRVQWELSDEAKKQATHDKRTEDRMDAEGNPPDWEEIIGERDEGFERIEAEFERLEWRAKFLSVRENLTPRERAWLDWLLARCESDPPQHGDWRYLFEEYAPIAGVKPRTVKQIHGSVRQKMEAAGLKKISG